MASTKPCYQIGYQSKDLYQSLSVAWQQIYAGIGALITRKTIFYGRGEGRGYMERNIKNIGVVVVHGIGDPKPGDTLRDFTNSICLNGNPIFDGTEPDVEIHWLDEEGESPKDLRFDNVPFMFRLLLLQSYCLAGMLFLRKSPSSNRPLKKFFPVPMRTKKECSSGRCNYEFTFAEVFWGNVSKLPEGWIGVLQGLWQLFVGIATIIECSRPGTKASGNSQPNLQSSILDFLVNDRPWFFNWFTWFISARLITGLVFSLNLILIFSYIFYRIFLPFRNQFLLLDLILPFIIIILSSVVAYWVYNFWKSKDNKILASGRLFSIILSIGWLVFALRELIFKSFLGYWLQYFLFLFNLVKNEPSASESLTWLNLLSKSFKPWQNEISNLWISIGSIPITFLKNLFLVIAVFILFAMTYQFLCSLRCNKDEQKQRQRQIELLAVTLQYDLWIILVPILWGAIFNIFPQEDSLSKKLYEQAQVLDGFQWLGLIIVGIVVYCVWKSRCEWAKKRKNDHEDKGEDVQVPDRYRLIINNCIGNTLLILNGIGILFFIVFFIQNRNSYNVSESINLLLTSDIGLPQIMNLMQLIIGLFNLLPNALLPILLFLLTILVEEVRIALDLVNDIITYLKIEKQQVVNNEEENPQENGAIVKRFREVINYMISKKTIGELIIVSHSQGTVIAVDGLNSEKLPDAQNIPIQLITMGSPLHHLYQHYFPEHYPSWNDNKWTKLSSRVTRWINLYRIDDYVGTQIDPGKEINLGNGLHVREFGIGIGGHLGYWCDKEAITRIDKLMLKIENNRLDSDLNSIRNELD